MRIKMEEQNNPQTRSSRTLHLFKKGVKTHRDSEKLFVPEVSIFVPVRACESHGDELLISGIDFAPQPILKVLSVHPDEIVMPDTTDRQERWDIPTLEKFFATTQLPDPPVRLNAWTTIMDIQRFVEAEFTTVIANNGNPTYRCSYDRLIQLMEIIINA
jgi:hypothetical protein